MQTPHSLVSRRSKSFYMWKDHISEEVSTADRLAVTCSVQPTSRCMNDVHIGHLHTSSFTSSASVKCQYTKKSVEEVDFIDLIFVDIISLKMGLRFFFLLF